MASKNQQSEKREKEGEEEINPDELADYESDEDDAGSKTVAAKQSEKK